MSAEPFVPCPDGHVRRPLIGLSTQHSTDGHYVYQGNSRRYAEAVAAAGGLPTLLPLLPELAAECVERIDALLLTGGADIHPRLYGAEPRRGLGETDDLRDACEVALYRAARQQGKPVLGVCRGMQLINALEGGTLHQHLPDVPHLWVQHAQATPQPALGHSVEFVEGKEDGRGGEGVRSLLAACHGHARRLTLNSYHHQGIERLAPSLRAVAYAPDGLIEAVEGDRVAGVQWHPEMLFGREPAALGAFRWLVQAVAAQ